MIEIPNEVLRQIHAHGEAAYPDEGAGFLLGEDGDTRRVTAVLPLPNAREGEARRRRYLITAQDMLGAEAEAERRALAVVGVFHSHPDHPNRPSEFDREWALPWFSYLITAVEGGQAVASRCWRLTDDRSTFTEEHIQNPD